MKSNLCILLTVLVVACFCTPNAYAQADTETKTEKKVVTVKKEIDADGNMTVEKTVKEVKMTVDGEGAEKMERKIIIKKSGDEGEEVIEWEGKGELPDDIKKKLEEHNIDLGDLEGANSKFLNENRAFLGVTMSKMITKEDDGTEKVEGVSDKGVVIGDVIDDSAAKLAGLKSGDIITAINENPVKTFGEMSDELAKYKPGNGITIDYIRDGKTVKTKTILKSAANSSKHCTSKTMKKECCTHKGTKACCANKKSSEKSE